MNDKPLMGAAGQRIVLSEEFTPPGPKSLENLKKLKRWVGKANYAGLFGITLAKGDRAYIEDVDGNVYLDCLTGASANILGYGNEAVVDAYSNAAAAMHHSCLPYSPNLEVTELAKQLVETLPDSDTYRAMFGLTGSDSVGGALVAMRKFTGRFSIMYCKHAYHGSTGLSQQASGFTALKEGLYRPTLDFIAIDYPAWNEDDPVVSKHSAAQILEQMETHLKTGRVGGLIIETVQGDAGVHLPSPDFFIQAKALLKHYGALLIVDEVQCGMGRTGSWWAIEQEQVIPDLLVTAKGMAAGYAPVSATLGRAEIIDTLGSAQHLFTFSGHGPSCAAALATIEQIQQQKLVENSANRGRQLLQGLRHLQAEFPHVIKSVRGRGLMIGLEIAVDDFPSGAKLFASRGVQLGVYLGFFGDEQQVVRIEPPLLIGDAEVDAILRVCQQVTKEMATQTLPSSVYENVLKYSVGL